MWLAPTTKGVSQGRKQKRPQVKEKRVKSGVDDIFFNKVGLAICHPVIQDGWHLSWHGKDRSRGIFLRFPNGKHEYH